MPNNKAIHCSECKKLPTFPLKTILKRKNTEVVMIFEFESSCDCSRNIYINYGIPRLQHSIKTDPGKIPSDKQMEELYNLWNKLNEEKNNDT